MGTEVRTADEYLKVILKAAFSHMKKEEIECILNDEDSWKMRKGNQSSTVQEIPEIATDPT